MQNPESVWENKIHNDLRDFEIQKHHLIPARRLDLAIINPPPAPAKKKKKIKKKDNLSNRGLYRPDRPQCKIKRKRKKRLVP